MLTHNKSKLFAGLFGYFSKKYYFCIRINDHYSKRENVVNNDGA